jgi:acyl-CoA synthetase (AMP-forming)/AMP-acid ligase II
MNSSGDTTLISLLPVREPGRDRGILFITGGDAQRRLDFAGLEAGAEEVLGQLQALGFGPGDELVLYCDDNERFLRTFWACLLGGIVPVPVAVGPSEDHARKLANIHASLKRPRCATTRAAAGRLAGFRGVLGAPLEALLDSVVHLDELPPPTAPGRRHPVQPGDVAFIQFSSGSTSAPKGVVLTHANVVTNIQGSIEAGRFTADDRALSWMPLTHDMGLIGFHLTMLAADIEHAIMDTALFVRRPLLWLEKAGELGSSVLCSPNFGYKHALRRFASRGLGGVDLSRVRLIFNGAEPISVELAREFMETLAPWGLPANTMYCVYGLAEASLAVTFPEPGTPVTSVTVERHGLAVGAAVRPAGSDDPDAITFARLGRVVPGCELRICDDEDRELGPDTVGHVQIRGGNVTGGYYGGADANRDTFADGGWLRTGDLGFIADGELVITGRSRDLIFVNGQNYYPSDLENLAEELEDLELGKVVVAGTTGPESGEDRILAFVLHRGEADRLAPLAAELRRHLGQRTGLELHEVIPVPRIPKTTSGKVQRHRLVTAYLDGEFDASLAALRDDSSGVVQENVAEAGLEQRLLDICNAVVEEREVHAEDNLFELGISSLALAEIHGRIDDAWPGQVDIADVFEYPSVRELAAWLEPRLEQDPG